MRHRKQDRSARLEPKPQKHDYDTFVTDAYLSIQNRNPESSVLAELCASLSGHGRLVRTECADRLTTASDGVMRENA